MGQMGRPGLSVQQKGELWTRWKSGQSLSDIGRPSVSARAQFSTYCFQGAELHRQRECDLDGGCRCRSEKRYRAASSQACRCVRLQHSSVELHQRSVGRSFGMVAPDCIERLI
jgi:hypothetical protein